MILEPKKIKSVTVSTFSPSICHEIMGLSAMILVSWTLNFKPALSLSSSTFIKRLFSSSSLSAIRVVSSAYLRFLIFLLAILNPACSSSQAFHIMYSQFSSVAQSCPTLQPHGLQHARFPCPSPIPRACSNLCPLSWWCHTTISSSAMPFSSSLQSFPTSESFPMSQFFTSGDQSIGVLASISVFPMNIQDWFPLGFTGSISLQSKGLSRVFSNTTVQKHQFFGTQLSLWSNSHIHTWLLEKP